ncbi:pentapeptide repeat-containing protein [Nocardia sp. CWNU-33]|uniref:pentapeptide repeat-containing protein n=1 Tax=Nocardia sp. CWNU-33 TaxID=3392117 RepID=UPI00398E805F
MSLTVVAGVGGVVALVVAYRRQRDLEQGRFVERFGAAAAQLGATDVAVRIAGVYAMAGVADESRGLRRQQCIDVLCGYLRLPYTPEFGGNHQNRSVRKRRGRGGAGENEDHFDYRQNDRAVRDTIVRVIAAHLRPTAERSWTTNDFDFRDAYFEDADFHMTTFSSAAKFEGATFSGATEFRGATFSSEAGFDRTTFSGSAVFDRTTFSGEAWFIGATFSGNALFGGARFSGITRFSRARFSSIADFDRTTFSGVTWFRDARFSGEAWFARTTFSSTAWLGGAKFSGTTRFNHARFSGAASFEKVDFGTSPISFGSPKQWGPPAPVFDWDQDVSQKPANVEPQDWPPAMAPAL